MDVSAASGANAQASAIRGGLLFGRFADRHFLVLAAWPALLAMLLVTAIPFAATLGLSLTNYDLGRSDAWQFIGGEHFFQPVIDPQTPRIGFYTLYLVIA